jgi:hypothetical protein
MKKRFLNSQTTTTVDPDTGQIVMTDIQKTHLVTLQDEDKFFMVYLTMLQSFYQIKYVKDVMLLVKFAELADYNTGSIDLSTKLRVQICEELEIKPSNFSTSIKRMVNLGLLIGEKGSYTLNAGLFWKGDAKTRKQVMKDRGLEFTIKLKME